MAELAAQPTSIQSVYTWFRENKLFVNRRYQRKLVWTLEEKQRLIESIIKKYPIPAILIAEKDDKPGSFEIIDGLQRLHAIVSFIETTFQGIDGLFFNLELFPTARSHSKAGKFAATTSEALLSQKEVSTILDYTLSLSVMRNATEDEINDVFGRINTYGHRLSDQERRQAGIRNEFSSMVRSLSCYLRGDVSTEILPLYEMPSISIDLPKTKHGYEVQADEVFWVQQGILRSTDLRDSMDEQYVSDIAACIVGGRMIERAKDVLDDIYARNSDESNRILAALDVYGANKFTDEFKYCVQEILKVCEQGKKEKLRSILFKNRNTNAFPSVFSALLIAFHELFVVDQKIISDYDYVKSRINDLSENIGTGRGATSIEERRKNIDIIKGLVEKGFVKRTDDSIIYANHKTIDIEGIVRRSEIELPNYELKQGLLTLSKKREIDKGIIEKICRTICAIANNGPHSSGKILLGVADKEEDVKRIAELDGVEPHVVGKRSIVGIAREAKILSKSVEEYYALIKDGINKSQLSDPLKGTTLSCMDFNSFYGLGVVVISIPPQKEISYYEDDVYWRNGDSTEVAKSAKKISEIAGRF